MKLEPQEAREGRKEGLLPPQSAWVARVSKRQYRPPCYIVTSDRKHFFRIILLPHLGHTFPQLFVVYLKLKT